MFDLDQALSSWRSRLLDLGGCRAADAEELETHVRATVEELSEAGLEEEEAFLVATHRLGHQAGLNEEFRKVNGPFVWRQRMLWLLGGYVLITLLHLLMGILSDGGIILAGSGGLGLRGLILVAVGAKVLLGTAFLVVLFGRWSRMRRLVNGCLGAVKPWWVALLVPLMFAYDFIGRAADSALRYPGGGYVLFARSSFDFIWELALIGSFLVLVVSVNRMRRQGSA